jgi:hypothetical protein
VAERIGDRGDPAGGVVAVGGDRADAGVVVRRRGDRRQVAGGVAGVVGRVGRGVGGVCTPLLPLVCDGCID